METDTPTEGAKHRKNWYLGRRAYVAKQDKISLEVVETRIGMILQSAEGPYRDFACFFFGLEGKPCLTSKDIIAELKTDEATVNGYTRDIYLQLKRMSLN